MEKEKRRYGFLRDEDSVSAKGGAVLRRGWTTGSAAAAAAKAAAYMLRSGNAVDAVRLVTPSGIPLFLEVEETHRGEERVSCAVRKYGGDDPDATDGTLIFAEVRRSEAPGVSVEGGKGVGRVTRPGLDQPVGNAAINSVPRKMIAAGIREVFGEDFLREQGISVVISVPEGEALAAKTFNPRLGIEGGISILGTTGIVEPMSDEAVLNTIRAEIRMRRAEGAPLLLLTPGNYGRTFLREQCGLPGDAAAEISNFAAAAAGMAAAEGFRKVLLTGHIGKLVKIAGGVRNTHSKYGDRRMEILGETARMAADGNMPAELGQRLEECVSTDEAVRILKECGLADKTLALLTERIRRSMETWGGGAYRVEVILFSGVHGLLGETPGAEKCLEELKQYLKG